MREAGVFAAQWAILAGTDIPHTFWTNNDSLCPTSSISIWIQLFATRIASKQWTESADTLNSHFCLPSLYLRRNYLKLLFMYKLVNSCVFCPYGLLQFHPNPKLRVSHEKQLVQLLARTSAFFNSYCISSIRAWNSLLAFWYCIVYQN